MPPAAHEASSLKRNRHTSNGDDDLDFKKPRRSQRISSSHPKEKQDGTPLKKDSQLPSPMTHLETSPSGLEASRSHSSGRAGTETPPDGRPSQISHRSPPTSPPTGLSSPPGDTQPYSQYVSSQAAISSQVQDEEAEGVWGYLVPMDKRFGELLVLRDRSACPMPSARNTLHERSGRRRAGRSEYEQAEAAYESTKVNGIASGGYLIGRHPECDRVLQNPTISNRHCLIFKESKGGSAVAVLEDLSGNGTFVNETFVGRNQRRELHDGDEIALLDETRCTFKYPRSRISHGFNHRYTIQQQLGKGHFATVYLAIEKASGVKYAVKKFEARPGPGERSRIEGLQQEIAVLMGVSHPNVLCLKETFNESDGVYIVLELAVEGELFNWIVMKSKLSEVDTRKVFIQLFQGIKYLHERNIVHRDIKPENILLTDKELSVKLADFGLAKIIGEESFTTTLCGTPSYVAPEILEPSNHRRYTRAVDVWSLGVVLYICLCGFPPFSDELNTPDNPYPLADQIKLARFDFPSPYWDPVSDAALDLIDKMLVVNSDERITIDECLEHPWTTQRRPDPSDSTDGLTGAFGTLDVARRAPHRERTLLSSFNEVSVDRVVPLNDGGGELRVFSKNTRADPHASQNLSKGTFVDRADAGEGPSRPREAPRGGRPEDFVQFGTSGDATLFGNDSGSLYVPEPKTSRNGKGKGRK